MDSEQVIVNLFSQAVRDRPLLSSLPLVFSSPYLRFLFVVVLLKLVFPSIYQCFQCVLALARFLNLYIFVHFLTQQLPIQVENVSLHII